MKIYHLTNVGWFSYAKIKEWCSIEKVKCPYCGYEMPERYDPKTAVCSGIFIRCKGKNCKKEFEIKINVK